MRIFMWSPVYHSAEEVLKAVQSAQVDVALIRCDLGRRSAEWLWGVATDLLSLAPR